MIFVVVVLMVTMVIFWCLQSSWLCVCVCWPSVCGGDDVVSCVVNVVLEVVIVFTSFNLCEMLAEILGFYEVDVILFLVI